MKEKIIELLKTKAHRYNEIKKHIKIEKTELSKLLHNMELSGEIFSEDDELYILFPNHFKIGKIQFTKQKNAFITYQDGSIQYLDNTNLNGALNYDTVVINQTTLCIEKILTREISQVVCEVKCKDNIKYLQPYNVVGNFHIRIDSNNMKHLKEGDRIVVDVSLEKIDEYFEGTYLKKIGNKNDPNIELRSIAISNGFHTEFPEECLKQLKAIPQTVTKKDINGRLDLRDKQIFTIDGEKTKDMDDAVSLEILPNGNYLLGVHIADVSHYIKKDTPLYNEAKERGTSLYMVDSVIPMLPSELSNGICSLNPHVDRLTISCIMEINQNAEIIDYQICKSVINSKMKMTYDGVNRVFNKETDFNYYAFEKNLLQMKELSNIITINKEKRGYLRFANTEIDIIEDKNGNIENVKQKYTGDAEELIENFMVMANTCVATHLGWIEFIPTIYRNHGKPNFDKVNMTLDFITNLGYRLRTAKNATNAIVLQKILQQLSNKEEFPILSTLILKSMQRAEYSTNNIGHFALELEYYTHFTSPIRRFPDLTIHRILKEYTNPNLEFFDFNTIEKDLQEISYHSSQQERQADIAEEEAKKLKLMEFIQNNLGQNFEGFVTDINEKEIRVQTKEGISGIAFLSHATSIKYVEKKRCLINKSNQTILKIGHHVVLKAIDLNYENNTPIFSIENNISLEESNQQKLVKKIS